MQKLGWGAVSFYRPATNPYTTESYQISVQGPTQKIVHVASVSLQLLDFTITGTPITVQQLEEIRMPFVLYKGEIPDLGLFTSTIPASENEFPRWDSRVLASGQVSPIQGWQMTWNISQAAPQASIGEVLTLFAGSPFDNQNNALALSLPYRVNLTLYGLDVSDQSTAKAWNLR